MQDMSTGSLYKLGDGECHLSNCFPVPEFFRHRQDGAGHWFVAHRETIEQRCRDIRRSKPNGPDHSAGADWATAAAGNTLDRSLLIQLHCVEHPSDLCSIDISEQRLTLVKNEDFKEFDNIVYINASDNALSIESFRGFNLLRELDLSLNGCCNMRFSPEDFPHLEVLDLSYNNVSENDIVCIGHLAGLKVLCLTGNRLHQLPANMAGSNHQPTLSQPTGEEEKPRYGVLEVLTLDDNRLSSDVFHSLANFPRLQRLNLQGNNVSAILLPSGGGAQTGSNQGHSLGISQPSVGEGESSPPLPQLQFLNLAHNKIAEEEALLAAALFPNLSELVIHNNPLTTQRTGERPLLTYLRVRRGVHVKTTDHPEVKRPSVTLPDSFKHKVRNERKVAERPHYQRQERMSQDVPKDPSSSQAEGRENSRVREGLSDRGDETQRQAQSVFVTQPEDRRDKELRHDAAVNTGNAGKKTHPVAVSPETQRLRRFNGREQQNRGCGGGYWNPDGRENAGAEARGGLIVCRDVKTKPPDHRRPPHTSPETRPMNMQGEKAEDIKSDNQEPSSQQRPGRPAGPQSRCTEKQSHR